MNDGGAGDSRPTPYYDEGGVTIYHGDGLAIARSLDGIDLILSDPPYGIGHVKGNSGSAVEGRTSLRRNTEPVEGDDQPFDPEPWLDYPNVMLWGANHFAPRLPDYGSWHAWDKTRGGCGPDDSFSNVEFAWASTQRNSAIFHYLWKGVCQDGEKGQRRYHPTQKPIALMVWCLRLFPDVEVVLDPYVGSGTTVLAARKLGLRAIGIDTAKRYCDTAIRRLAQGDLFSRSPNPSPHR
jgi:DNA modification methylase